MKRIICILLILAAFNTNVNAGERARDRLSRITFGVEWGYVATFWNGHYSNFFAPEGYRVEDSGNELGIISNADMYAHAGYDFNAKWNLSLYVGYEGIADLHKGVPMSIRLTRFFGSDPSLDRWLAFVDVGSGICIKQPPQEILTGKLGGGYRLALSRTTSLDFILSARFARTHTQIIYDKTLIPLEKINKNVAYISAISVGMSLNF